MNPAKTFAAACLLAAALTHAAPACAAEPLRQYYTAWTYHAERGYWYRTYHYKPYADYLGYRHLYCTYYMSQPRYVYFYDPYERIYWGRFDSESPSGEQFSVLKDADCRERLTDIPFASWPPSAKMPVIPGSIDGEMMAPPDDLPKLRRD